MANTVRKRDPAISQETIDSFGRNMFGSDFVKPHPAHTSAEIAGLAPNIEVQKDWRGPEFLPESIRRVRAFLARNTPTS